MSKKTSNETQAEALRVAKGTQVPGQTKEQTKLIARGIEKGIAEYKKQQKAKARERDKQRKQQLKNAQRAKAEQASIAEPEIMATEPKTSTYLPWILLVLSWVGFIAYLYR